MKPPIIKNPSGASWIQRYSQRFLTGTFWLAFALLLRPLLTVGAWLTGWHFLSTTLLGEDGLLSLLRVPYLYPLIVVIIGAVLIGWANYNYLRFRHNERRTRQPAPLTAAELAAFFRVDEAQVRRWQQSRRIVLNHDAQGSPWEKPE